MITFGQKKNLLHKKIIKVKNLCVTKQKVFRANINVLLNIVTKIDCYEQNKWFDNKM